MIDMEKLQNAFVEHIQTHFAEDVALVLLYGSHLWGDHHGKSDLDIVFITDNARGAQASIQFIIGDIGFDFFPLTWQRAESIAAFNEPFLTILLDSKIIYSRSKVDEERLESIRRKALWHLSPEGWPAILNRASERFRACCVYLYNMRIAASNGDLTSAKIEAAKLFKDIIFIILMLNQTYSKKGWIKDYALIESLPIRPKGLSDFLNVIMNASDPNDVLQAGEQLADQTRDLLLEEIRKTAKPEPYSAIFPGVYEEIKTIVQKVNRACDQGDSKTPFFCCLSWQDELARFLEKAETGVDCNSLFLFSDISTAYKQAHLPDFATIMPAGNMGEIQRSMRLFDENSRNHLEAKGVQINQFEDIETLLGRGFSKSS